MKDIYVVEGALPISILKAMVDTKRCENNLRPEVEKKLQQALVLARESEKSLFDDIYPLKKANSLERRTWRIAIDLLLEKLPDAKLHTAKILLVWLHFTESLISDKLFVAAEDSDFGKAFSIFRDLVEAEFPNEFNNKAIDKSARKQARQWRDYLTSKHRLYILPTVNPNPAPTS